MNCLALLRISTRLVDLHDAERLPGNSPVFSQEERRGLRDGRYLDLAGLVLEVLRTNSHNSGNAFIGFDALLIGVRALRQELDVEDLRYVLNVLSRPTELWAVEREGDVTRLVSDKANELVEKTFFAEDYRLAPAGRAAIAVAANIQSFAYAEGDALKLLRAIEAGDFSRVPVFCTALLDAIRYESIDLRQILEKGFIDRESAIYREQLPRYRQVIRQSAELLRQADAKLKLWRSSENEKLDDEIPIDLYELEQYLLRVYQALESFGRELADLTSLAAQRRASVVAAPDFIKAALDIVRHPPKLEQTIYLFRQFGPISLNGVYPSPIDVAGKVRVAPVKTLQSTRFETAGATTVSTDTRLSFLGEFSDAIRERLALGPLPLGEAIDSGWCSLDGKPALEELLGIYVGPWSLEADYPVEIRVPRTLKTHVGSVIGEVILSDLELVLQQPGANE